MSGLLLQLHTVTILQAYHCFLCGLGPSYETFSTTQRVVKPRPSFPGLLSQAEVHELFLRYVHGSTSSPVAFNAHPSDSLASSNRGSYRGGRGGRSGVRGRGRRSPHCQLCKKDCDYVTECLDLTIFSHR